MAIFKPANLKTESDNADINRIVQHINILQEQLEWVLTHLDSDNITEIDSSITNIS